MVWVIRRVRGLRILDEAMPINSVVLVLKYNVLVSSVGTMFSGPLFQRSFLNGIISSQPGPRPAELLNG
jgi:hypothetical protein